MGRGQSAGSQLRSMQREDRRPLAAGHPLYKGHHQGLPSRENKTHDGVMNVLVLQTMLPLVASQNNTTCISVMFLSILAV